MTGKQYLLYIFGTLILGGGCLMFLFGMITSALIALGILKDAALAYWIGTGLGAMVVGGILIAISDEA